MQKTLSWKSAAEDVCNHRMAHLDEKMGAGANMMVHDVIVLFSAPLALGAGRLTIPSFCSVTSQCCTGASGPLKSSAGGL
jgi:hypothetical protein